jgi:DNA-binding NtrC family response regulator
MGNGGAKGEKERRPHVTMPSTSIAVPVPKIELAVTREAGRSVDKRSELDGEVFRVGSNPGNELVLEDPRVSRFHLRIAKETDAWRVYDWGSKNGTALNGVRIRDAELRMPECELELGDSIVRVRELPSSERVPALACASYGALFGRSLAMQKLFGIVDRVSKSMSNVLIEGESGTGKELVASEIVKRGPRAEKPFIVLDCSAISPHVIESELFGHKRGAFTGADRDHEGLFEKASGGTIFLDEIGEMPIDMQPKLLRALESREVRRVGEAVPRKVDVRVLAATNRRLEREINRGRFREDLYFRLGVLTIRTPALRERREDLPLLVNAFLEVLEASDEQRSLFTASVLAELAENDWPGNVRQLKNYVERAVVLMDARIDETEDRGEPSIRAPAAHTVDLDLPFNTAKARLVGDFERTYLTTLLEWAGGNVSKAARRAKMDRMNLHRLVQLYGLRSSRSLD